MKERVFVLFIDGRRSDEELPFRHGEFELSNRHPSGDIKSTVRYMRPAFRTDVLTEDINFGAFGV